MSELTPMMRQYMEIKEQHKDCLLFFRLGDFYEMFFDDALLASRELEITLTGRDCGMKERAPMCGVPFHAVDTYVNRLIQKGYKVAICEQLTDPATAKGMVDRGVVRIITPGTIIEDSMLDAQRNNYLACACIAGDELGLAYVDISTGDYHAAQVRGAPMSIFAEEIARIKPGELLIDQNLQVLIDASSETQWVKTPMSILPAEAYEQREARERLAARFGEDALQGAGELAVAAAGALLSYLAQTQMDAMDHINQLQLYRRDGYMILDATTRRNLELTETMREKKKAGTLLWVLDQTVTAMGGRALRQWIEQPLQDLGAIQRRLNAIEAMVGDLPLRDGIREALKGVYDIERLASRIVYGTINARDALSLLQSAQRIGPIKAILAGANEPTLASLNEHLDELADIAALLEQAIAPDAGITIRDGGIIREGFRRELDETREAGTKGKEWLAKLEQEEREATGIKTLKIGFNRVFGYFIEVTRSYYHLVPYRYQRKQTLADKERYITDELKKIEEQVLGAQERAVAMEYEIFLEVRQFLKERVTRIQDTARLLAQLDVIQSMAKVAVEQDYVKPELHPGTELEITDGRHPVVDKALKSGMFVPNSTLMDTQDNRVAILTGPNMAGKSTYLRQVALIALMGHIGSFVPARAARIGRIDRIFTRVGASDDLALGQSTFMVEMVEMANILKNATQRSLLILDEIGRGTSTFDGLSIAWSVVEYIADPQIIGAKTLFATHYHELSELEGRLPGTRNYCISVKEHGEDIIFLRKILRGGASRSFGIEVAKLAGLPEPVIRRAKQILKRLEEADINNASIGKEILAEEEAPQAAQVDLFAYPAMEFIQSIQKLDVDSMTPLEALNALDRICREAQHY